MAASFSTRNKRSSNNSYSSTGGRSSGGFGYSSAFASSSASTFTHSSSFFTGTQTHSHRSASPTRINLVGSTTNPSPSVKSHAVTRPLSTPAVKRKTCMCSPTNHPGSFRCALHKGFNISPHSQSKAVSSPSNRLNMRRSAMTNSLVRIGTVEGELLKRTLAALIRPSSHQQRRREGFQTRPSRLSVMSKAED